METTTTDVTEEIKALESVLAEKEASRDEIISTVKGTGAEGDPLDLTADHAKALKESLAETKEIEDSISVLKGHQDSAEFRKSLHAPSPMEPAAIAAAVTEGLKSGALGEEDLGGLGHQFTNSDEFKAMMDAGKFTMDTPFRFKGLGDVLSTKDVYSSLPSGTPAAFGQVQRDPMVQRPQRAMRVRDLFPSVRTTAAVIEYFRVTGFTNNASPVPERDGSAFGAKPQSTLTFTGEQASVRTIAHWEAAHRNVLADEPVLQATIENELLYGLALTEDDQILNGAGTSEDLLGILNASIQTYSWSSGETAPVADNKADALRRAATLAMLAYYPPTGVVVHDSDWEDIELAKNSQGDYLLAVSIAMGGEPRVWRMPVVATPAIAAGTALVGAFGLGAQLYDRQDATIRIAEQHSDFFVRNAVVMLAEQREALAVKRPDAFVNVTFDAAPS